MLIENEKDRAVLVVDDSRTIRRTANTLIEKEGIQVITARDGYEALEVLRKEGHRIYLILLDLMMPRIDGFSFLKYIAHSHPVPVGVTALTSKDGIEDKNNFFGQAVPNGSFVFVVNYLTKPFSKDELVNEITYVFREIHEKRKELLKFNPTLDALNSRLESAYCNISSLIDLTENVSVKIDHTVAEIATKNDLNIIDKKLNRISHDQLDILDSVNSGSDSIKSLMNSARSAEVKSSFVYVLGLEVVKIIVLSIFIIFLLRIGVADLIIEILNGTSNF
jgi:twitching motility two-component system response regulator PilG